MSQIYTDLIPGINQSLDICLPAALSKDELRNNLAEHISHLINHDFEKLIYYLYRVDVDEHKMRRLLNQREGENAAGLIADLIIERQIQKIESRRKHSSKEDIPDDEKW
jgi:hypothetical protein